jgi:hypothetical protein
MRIDPSHDNRSDTQVYELDPVFVSSRREAIFVLIVFAVFAVFVIGVSYGLGNRLEATEGEPVSTILGLPTWVFWGILVPWGAANVVTAWYCLSFMSHESLEEAGQGEIDLESARE